MGFEEDTISDNNHIIIPNANFVNVVATNMCMQKGLRFFLMLLFVYKILLQDAIRQV